MGAIIGGALIQAAGSLGGGAMSSKEARRNVRFQKQFAKKGIQWRVEDAKAAGVHPLYALGAQLPSFSPVQSGIGDSLAAAGQDIGRAVSARMNPVQREAIKLELQQKQADLDRTHAETRYIETNMRDVWASRLARINDQISQPLPQFNQGEGVALGNFSTADSAPPGRMKPDAATSISSSITDPGIAHGTTPMVRQFTLPGGLPILLPGGMSGDPSEALETLSESPLMMWSVYKMNREKFGPEWASKFRAKYLWGDSFESLWKWSARNRGKPAAPRSSRTRQDYR